MKSYTKLLAILLLQNLTSGFFCESCLGSELSSEVETYTELQTERCFQPLEGDLSGRMEPFAEGEACPTPKQLSDQLAALGQTPVPASKVAACVQACGSAKMAAEQLRQVSVEASTKIDACVDEVARRKGDMLAWASAAATFACASPGSAFSADGSFSIPGIGSGSGKVTSTPGQPVNPGTFQARANVVSQAVGLRSATIKQYLPTVVSRIESYNAALNGFGVACTFERQAAANSP